MSGFSVGKNSYAISDRSGLRYRYKDMRREWNGLLVGPDEFEPKQPQLGPFRTVADPQALRDARPDRVEPEVARLLDLNPFSSGGVGTNIITVTEVSHGRTTGSIVRFRNVFGFDGFTKEVSESTAGYGITVSNQDKYTFTATSGTATSGNTRGGGQNASAGPVTLVS